MKTKYLIIAFFAFVTSRFNGQEVVNVTIENMTYLSGGSIPSCSTIDFEDNSLVTIQFGIKLQKPSSLVIGTANLKVLTKKTASDFPVTRDTQSVQESFWSGGSNQVFTASLTVTLSASEFNLTGGKLYAEFAGYESCQFSLQKNAVPTFTLTPATVSIPCGSTNPVTFMVNNVYNSPGTRDHIWTIGSGWELTDGSVAPSTYNTGSVANLTLVPNANPPGNVSVVPKLNGVSYPMKTSVVSRGGFNPTYPITGSDALCTTAVYSVDNLPAGITVTGWTSSNTSIATVSSNGNQATLTKVTNGEVNLTATLSNSCGQSGTLRKNGITVGSATVSNHTILGGYDNQSVNSVSNFSVAAASGATQYYWTLTTISSNCSIGTAKPRFAYSNSTTYTSNLPNSLVEWNQCPGSYIVQCYARNGCGDTPIGHKVINVYDQNSNPCPQSKMTSEQFMLKRNPIKGGSITLNRYPPQDPCNNLKNTSVKPVENLLTIFNSFGKAVYSTSYRENDITIENLKLNTGFYILEIVSGSFRKRQVLVVE